MTGPKQSTQEQLFRSLEELMQTRSIQSVTVQSIVDSCGKTKPTFYKYFRDKYDLMSWGIIELFYVPCMTDGGVLLDWRESNIRFLQLILEEPAFFRNAFRYDGQNSLTDTLVRWSSSQLANVIKAAVPPLAEPDLENALFAVEFCGHAFWGLFRRWILDGTKESPEYIVEKSMLCIPDILWSYLFPCPRSNNGGSFDSDSR